MKLFISIVNHHHDELICSNNELIDIASEHHVVIKSNTLATNKLVDFCNKNNINLIQGYIKKGFGENNNDVFNSLHLRMNFEKDYFLILNPDVFINIHSINKLLIQAEKYKSHISAINLFKDLEMNEFDNSIRYTPKLSNPLKGLLGITRKDFYDKSSIADVIDIDWAAGSFLLIHCDKYKQLNGFDERYFMYYEDADLCRRAHKMNISVKYFPDVKATHLAQHQNRKILSKHFYYYCCSFTRYFLKS